MFHNIIRMFIILYVFNYKNLGATLVSNPYSRPTIQDLCEDIEKMAFDLKINLESSLNDLDLPSHQNLEPDSSNNTKNEVFINFLRKKLFLNIFF